LSAKWCVIGIPGKDKRYSPWSDDCEQIINFAATCMGLATDQIISSLCLSPRNNWAQGNSWSHPISLKWIIEMFGKYPYKICLPFERQQKEDCYFAAVGMVSVKSNLISLLHPRKAMG
jgi:hypothetical protein